MVEQIPVKDKVPGSSPGRGAKGWKELVVSKFTRASRSEAYGGVGVNSIRRFLRKRFEPKICWREVFLAIRSVLVAVSVSNTAFFIHSRIGSSQLPAFCSR